MKKKISRFSCQDTQNGVKRPNKWFTKNAYVRVFRLRKIRDFMRSDFMKFLIFRKRASALQIPLISSFEPIIIKNLVQ